MSRKYRQRGYQDDSREEERSRERAPQRKQLTKEERIQRKSLRHAIDREAAEVVRCHVCGRSIYDFGVISPSTTCPHCNAGLHCCRNCRHFDSAARWQCRAEITESVADKNKVNQCTHYQPRLVLDATGRRTSKSGGGKPGDPRSQFENLFKR